jgi:lipid-A-disaccharide synthase
VERTVLILTGEASGDLAAAELARELRQLAPNVRIAAVGGAALRSAGAEMVADIERLGAMGILEVLRQLPRLTRLSRQLDRFLSNGRPDVVVPVDYPGFNLRFAARAKRRGIPVVYYSAPQVWAWGAGRIRRMRETIDRLMVVLPFEEKLFRAAGIDAEFVGHPLMERIASAPSRSEARRSLGIPEDALVLGLLPGSRLQEILVLLPVQLEGARKVREMMGDLTVLVSQQKSVPLAEYASVKGPGERLVEGAQSVIAASDALLVTSGTATLESALMGTPLAVVYRTSPLTYLVGKSMVRLRRIGLVNIVAGEDLAPEFLQERARGDLLATWALGILREADRRREVSLKLLALRRKFEGKHASRRAAEIVLETMERRQ